MLEEAHKLRLEVASGSDSVLLKTNVDVIWHLHADANCNVAQLVHRASVSSTAVNFILQRMHQ